MSKYNKILTEEYLRQKYIDEKKSCRDIAEILNCSYTTVKNYLRKFDLTRDKCVKGINIGDEFGEWKVLEIVEENNITKIKCKCSCGTISNVYPTKLRKWRSKSCGCISRRLGKDNPHWRGYGDISGNILSNIRSRAKRAKIYFELTAEILNNIFIQQNRKCAISGLDIEIEGNASLDRIDSSKGYVENNVWWVHKDVNKMKMDLDLEYFLDMCDTISQQRKVV